MKKFETIIAIDPGKSGGIAHWNNGRIQAVKMPGSVFELNRYLKHLHESIKNPIVFIEKVQAYRGKSVEEHQESFFEIFQRYSDKETIFEEFIKVLNSDDDVPGKKFGINKMLANYAELTTVIQLIGFPWVEVYPVSWQSSLGLRIHKDTRSKTERKNSYKDYAQNCFPELKITHATGDALCLVAFGQKKLKHDPRWIRERLNDPSKSGLF
jgi:hypothetical protein